jgi:hypothetical protein
MLRRAIVHNEIIRGAGVRGLLRVAQNKLTQKSNRLMDEPIMVMPESQEPRPRQGIERMPFSFAMGHGGVGAFSHWQRLAWSIALGMLILGLPGRAWAGKLSWLDDLVQEVIVEAKAGGKSLVRGSDGASAEIRRAGRLFLSHQTDEGLENLVRRSDELARAGRRLEQPSEALLQARFSRLLKHDPQALRTFSALKPAEKRLVVELGETAQQLARRYPANAESIIRRLGPEGMTAVRVFGDDVAEVLVKEGPESLSVLRKAGRGGWSFFTDSVLPHKKKLAAAGVLAAFLANPEKFVDYAGRATEFAFREFAKAGVQLASAVGGGAARGLESSIGQALAACGLDFAVLRYLGMALAGLVVVVSLLVIVGLPVRWMFRPFFWPLRWIAGLRQSKGVA